jgi:hypothetical protein
MEILRHPDKTWGREEECDGCKALLKLDVSDLTCCPGERDGAYTSPTYYTFTCPCCDNTNHLSEDAVPEHLRCFAKKKSESTW